jgi:hypothetical protein
VTLFPNLIKNHTIHFPTKLQWVPPPHEYAVYQIITATSFGQPYPMLVIYDLFNFLLKKKKVYASLKKDYLSIQ